MTRYLILALTCVFLVACGGEKSTPEREYMSTPDFGSDYGLNEVVESACVKIKATGQTVRMDKWIAMGQPVVDLESVTSCGGK